MISHSITGKSDSSESLMEKLIVIPPFQSKSLFLSLQAQEIQEPETLHDRRRIRRAQSTKELSRIKSSISPFNRW